MYKEIDRDDLIDRLAQLRTEQADFKELEHIYYENVYEYMTDLTLQELQEIAKQIGLEE